MATAADPATATNPATAEKRLRVQLAHDLRVAIKARDGARVAAVRALIAALDNATAVPIESQPIPVPFGNAEVPRKVLTDDDVKSILKREIAARHDAAWTFESHGCFEEALGLRDEIALFESYVAAIGWDEGVTHAERADQVDMR
ncbi:MAG TPA: GatB/YqeY domain-containing protein [Steroidobacteraceae bacterium]|nr:GatB/YqeY domain-containing protein [Steroidobacteraceae bacterium]